MDKKKDGRSWLKIKMRVVYNKKRVEGKKEDKKQIILMGKGAEKDKK